jgi:peptidoglycan/xylan/chitin deacetylase (PgdA/CDA1 family)
MTIQFPDLLRPLLGNLTWRKSAKEKVIYLTFDDGPIPEVTPKVLAVLDEYEVKATFFCVGENVQKHPDVYAQVLERGHRTGNHTFNHIKGVLIPAEEYVSNVEQTAKLIDSKLFRPPHGLITRAQRKALENDYQIIMWDLITHDYNKSISPNTILKTIRRKSRNGMIVVFHDSLKAQNNMMAVLPSALQFWKSEGYQFGVL